jgi:ribonuclease G
MNKELYVSSTPHETKVAMVEDDQLAEVYFERENEYTLAGSIYKGRVTRVLPGMQSAFVDIGLERDAFLYVSDFLELEEEDEEVGQVQLQPHLIDPNKPGPQLASEAEVEGVDEAEEDGGEEASAEAGDSSQQDEGEGRRWRGRRRRRGRRGGRERSRNDEASGSETVEASQSAPQEQEKTTEPEVVAEAPVQQPSYERILLPGESIARYQGGATETPAESQPSEERPERESRYDRGDRGGRFGRRGRRDRFERRERREEEPYTLPADYQPIVLPGESISKYRGQEAAEAAEEPKVGTTEELSGEVTPFASAAEDESVRVAASAEAQFADTAEPHVEETPSSLAEPESKEPLAAAPPHEPVREEPKPQKKSWLERMNLASVFGGDEVEEKSVAEDVHATVDEAPTPLEESHATAAPETQEPSGDWRDKFAETTPEWTPTAHAESAPASHEESAVEGESQQEPGQQAGSYVIEGGNVEHEEIDEDEAEIGTYEEELDHYHPHEFVEETLDAEGGRVNGAEVLGDVVRETDEEAVLEQEEYEFNGDGRAAEGDEFEESEMLAADEEENPEDGHAELRAPAGTAGYQQRQERSERPGYDRRGGDRGRGRRGFRRGGMRPRREFRPAPAISDLLKEGQEVLIQIAKEPIGKKGARITSHIALPGRFLVYMPTVNHIGVSRKINSDEERQRLKRIVASERENGQGGFIVRTAAASVREEELRADIRFLKHLWAEIRNRAENSKSPALIYHDLNLVERVLRDQVTSDFSQIWVDSQEEYERVVRFASRFQSGLLKRIKLYTKSTPLFEQFGIQDEINKSLKSKVWLKSGGYIVINQTEALVAIDINTGKYVGKTARLEDTIVKTNCDAIKEIVRQIRLRDLGGIIVIDFIDMDERKNRQKVMQTLEEELKYDRAPSKVLQFNDFGLVAITRKRVKQSLERTLGTPCPYCTATGFVKSPITVANEIFVEMKKVRKQVDKDDVILRVNPEVAKELKAANGKRIQELEELVGRPVLVKNDPQLHQEQFDINF